jgi:hypothetical protein
MVAPAPLLSISMASNSNGVVLSWPSSASGYSLQESVNLASPGWATIWPPLTDNSTNISALISPAPGTRFYRLRFP